MTDKSTTESTHHPTGSLGTTANNQDPIDQTEETTQSGPLSENSSKSLSPASRSPSALPLSSRATGMASNFFRNVLTKSNLFDASRKDGKRSLQDSRAERMKAMHEAEQKRFQRDREREREQDRERAKEWERQKERERARERPREGDYDSQKRPRYAATISSSSDDKKFSTTSTSSCSPSKVSLPLALVRKSEKRGKKEAEEGEVID